LAKELLQGHYDFIIGVHAPLAARLATLRPYLPTTKLIGWIHNSFEALFSETSLYIGADRKRHYVYQFQKLDKVIVLCNHDAETYQKYDSKFRPIVIYNPLTLTPGKRSEGNTHRFLAIGRFSHQHKGFDLLIEAFYIYAQKNSDWILDIVGEGVEESLYKSLIKKYNLEDRIKIHQFTNDIQEYYSKSQIYVLSSRWEGFGLVLVEAMAHGLPIVSSDLPTSKEIMGDFGLYFKNGNYKDLAECLEKATQINWKEKSKEALEIANKFDIKQIINEWKKVIE
jgi:glycosyltransferase involved in cell wall biosynthesis